MLAFFNTFTPVSIAALLIGTGGACYEPSALALFANSSEGSTNATRKTFIQLNLALNAGAITGPLLGGILFTDAKLLFLISASLFFCLFLLQRKLLPALKPNIQSREQTFSSGLKSILNNKPYLLFCLAMVFFWFMFTQLTVAFPLHMFHLTGKPDLVFWVVTINASVGLLFMFASQKWLAKKDIKDALRSGFHIMTIAMTLIGLISSPSWLIFCLILFTIGETLVLPTSDAAISEFSKGRHYASYYGFFELSFAVGATLGNYVGTAFFSNDNNSIIQWLIFGLAGLIGSSLLKLETIRSKLESYQ
ncbi:MFS transporter [Paenibacillus taihuensis]|uniref:MFS transporter n=2 Tax=Paenibacillus taihuensis TaxID=1156355 RepID=A0A3D9QUI8_9BACL|nr:MFS transporter [Paenibacillus taihuensis]